MCTNKTRTSFVLENGKNFKHILIDHKICHKMCIGNWRSRPIHTRTILGNREKKIGAENVLTFAHSLGDDC